MPQIYTGPSLHPVQGAETLRQLLDQSAVQYKNETAYLYRKKPKSDDFAVSYPQLRDDVLALAEALTERGVAVGSSRIAVIGENSYPWVLAFNAAVACLGIAVPLDHQLPDAEALRLVKRGRVTVFAYSRRHAELARKVAEEVPEVQQFILLSQDEAPETMEDPRFAHIDHLLQEGAALRSRGVRRAEAREPQPGDLASIVFTSGTTSDSKGVMLSQKNIAANAQASAESFLEGPPTRALSVLPLHHTFENTVGMYALWYLGVTICINDGLRYVAENLRSWEVGIIVGVPLLVNNIYNQIMRAIKQQKLGWILKKTLRLSRFLRSFGMDQRQRIFGVLRKQLGGKLHLIVVGAAALDPEVADFFDAIGIDCLSGYGMSEASPVLACNRQGHKVNGSVGWAMPGVQLCLSEEDVSDDGHGHSVSEILANGSNIMQGYLDAPDLTAEAIDSDGWLHTGDIGYFDEHEALHITGRKKSMLVLSNGKKAFPEEIEGLLKQIPSVQESFVWDEVSNRGSVIICAKLLLKRDDLPLSKSADDEEISAWLRRQVNEVNHQMPVYKAISAFVWTEEPLQMTTTMKVRRPAELAAIRAEMNDRGLSMQEADGQRMPDKTHFDFQEMAK